MARNKKIVVNEKELSNLYQDLSQDILKKLTFDQTVEDNQNQLLFLTCCEKSLTYFADEVSSYFKNDLKDFNTLNFFYKWRELSEISTISNIIVNEIGQNGFINQINLFKSNILQKDNDNLIVSTQATGDGQGGQGSQGNNGEPSIPFFARVKDFVLNGYIVMDIPALPATGANAGIGVTNAALVKIIDHRGLVRRVRVNAVINSDTITRASVTNPFKGTELDPSSSQTIHKDVQKGMIAIGDGIPDYTVVDEVISKTQLKLSANVTKELVGEDIFFYDSKGLRDNTLLEFCSRFDPTPQVRCLTAKVKDAEGNPVPGGLPINTTSFEVEDDNGVASTGWTLQGIYFGDSGTAHSPIIGWAYDGNPIYGPYGYSDPTDDNSGIKVLTSGYVLDPSNVCLLYTSPSPRDS